MAKLMVNEGTFRADLFKIAGYFNYESASTTSQRVEFHSDGGNHVRRLTGEDFVDAGNGAPQSGTITAITEIKNGVPLFTLSGFSLSWADFEQFGVTGDADGFLAEILAGGDALAGNGLKDVLSGFGGDDTIAGGAGNDKIMGEDGADLLDGGAGRDVLIGGLGDDTYVIDTRHDRVIEKDGEGFDCVESAFSLSLGAHLEELVLTEDANIKGIGNGSDNRLIGNIGNNVLNGKRGADTMVGDLGDDLYIVDDAGDVVTEAANAGSDSVMSSIDYRLGDHTEHLKLTGKAVGGTGNALANTIRGNARSNILDGQGGDDTLKGGNGNDTLVGGAGDDVLDGYRGADCASYAGAAGAVNVSLALSEAQDTGAAGNDVLIAIEWLIGGDHADTLAGNAKANHLDGGLGADTLSGGTGNDTYVVNEAGDMVVEAEKGGYDVVECAVTYTLAANVERLHLTGTGDIDGTGNASRNVIKGNDGANRLDGGADRDVLAGGLGDDTYVVDDRHDRIYEARHAGVDVVQSAATFRLAANLEHLELTGAADIKGIGNGLDNRLTGNAGDNRLVGKRGDDTLHVLSGDDTLQGGSGDDLYIVSGGLENHTLINDYRGVDTLRFDGVDPFVEVSGVERVGHHLVFTFQAGGSLTLYRFFRGKPLETLEAWGLPFDMPRDFTGAASLSSYLGVDVGTATDGDDVIVGENASGDDIHGLGGNDRIAGIGDDDTLSGEAGDDTLSGGSGDDVLVGGPGADSLDGGDGGDTASYAGSESGVLVNLASGTGSGGDADGDTLVNIENLIGSDHGDTLTGDAGGNLIDGGDGDDILSGGAGADSLVGGAGSDTAGYAGSNAGVTVDLDTGNTGGGHAAGDTLSGIEHLTASDHGDTLAGDGGANMLDGGDGDDVLIGRAGADSLIGGDGDDTASYGGSDAGVTVDLQTGIHGGGHAAGDTLAGIENVTGSEHNDTLTGDADGNALDGANGDDVLIGGAGADTLTGGDGDDTASYAASGSGVDVDLETGAGTGGHATGDTLSGVENLIGSGHGDTLSGGIGDNILDGGDGDDLLAGGAGADTLYGGDGADTASYAGSDAAVGINLGSGSHGGGHAAGDTLSGIEHVIGSGHGDTLAGDGGNNVLDGGDGDDVLSGGAGADSLIGGDGNDTASYAGSDAPVDVDLVTGLGGGGHAAGDTLNGVENLTGSDHGDTLAGGAGGNVLDGGKGDDLLIGRAGGDSLVGGEDDDTASYAGSDAAVSVDLGGGTHDGGHASGDTLSGIENLAGSEHGDTLAGDAGANVLDGAAGDDVLIGGAGADSLLGGEGDDTASYAGSDTAVSIDLRTGVHGGGHASGDTLDGIENLTGSDHGDTLAGDGGDNLLDGGDGDDILNGGAGADSLVGGDGGDTASYAGSDTAVSIDLLTGNHGGGHAAGDTLEGIENLTGSDHGDTLAGDDGGNVLDGGDGDDVIIGGAGADSLIGGDGDDTASYAGSDGAVSVNLQSGPHGGGHAAGDTLEGIENLTGSGHGDTLTGDAGHNRLDGGDGDDVLDGGDGDDQLVGGSGMDTLAGGLGTDTLWGGVGDDRFVFSGALGNQHVADFAAGDRIGFAFGLVAHFEALDTNDSGTLDDADADITIAGGHTIIEVGGGQVTVENETGLDATDFFYF